MPPDRIAPADPDVALTLAYAPARARPALSALFALDERLSAIARRPGEPAIVLLRLVWWRDALAALETGPPPAEPLLVALADAALSGTLLADVAESWETLVADPDRAPGTIADHARLRGETLFSIAGALLGAEVPAGAGAAWAYAQLEPGAPLDAALATRWPRAARPLGLLVALADVDRRHPSKPRRRMLRVLGHMLTGR